MAVQAEGWCSCGGEWKLICPHRKEVLLLPTDVFIVINKLGINS
jgi:hypothetical protein